MWTERFDPESGAILIDVVLYGPMGHNKATFLLDTGAYRTSVSVELTDELGYGAHLGRHTTNAIGAGGEVRGYLMPLQRLDVMGRVLENLDVVCEDIDPRAGIDGLIGMDLLRGHILTIDSIEGRVTLAP